MSYVYTFAIIRRYEPNNGVIIRAASEYLHARVYTNVGEVYVQVDQPQSKDSEQSRQSARSCFYCIGASSTIRMTVFEYSFFAR